MSRSVEEFLSDLDDVLSTTGQDTTSTATATAPTDSETRHDTATRQHDTTTVEDKTLPDTRDTTAGQPAAPRVVHVTGKSGRLPDWWRGPASLDALNETPRQDTPGQHDTTPGHDTATGHDGTDTETGQPGQDTEEEEEDTRPWWQYVREETRAGWKSAWNGEPATTKKDRDTDQDKDKNEERDKEEDRDTETGQDTDQDGTPGQDKDKKQDTAPGWDPTRIAGRLVESHRNRPYQDRATTTGKAAVAALTADRAPIGRLIYAATSIGAAWWIGLTPWLIEHLDGAPLGIHIALVLITWSIHQATAGPVRWCAHSLFTSSVIAAFLA